MYQETMFVQKLNHRFQLLLYGQSEILFSYGYQGQVVSLEEQIENLQKTKEQIIGLIGKVATDELFAKSPFVVVTGSNDWLLSYFNPLLPYIHLSSLTIEEHRDKLVQKLISHIKVYLVNHYHIYLSTYKLFTSTFLTFIEQMKREVKSQAYLGFLSFPLKFLLLTLEYNGPILNIHYKLVTILKHC